MSDVSNFGKLVLNVGDLNLSTIEAAYNSDNSVNTRRDLSLKFGRIDNNETSTVNLHTNGGADSNSLIFDTPTKIKNVDDPKTDWDLCNQSSVIKTLRGSYLEITNTSGQVYTPAQLFENALIVRTGPISNGIVLEFFPTANDIITYFVSTRGIVNPVDIVHTVDIINISDNGGTILRLDKNAADTNIELIDSATTSKWSLDQNEAGKFIISINDLITSPKVTIIPITV